MHITWIVILGVSLGSIALKSAGPLLLGNRKLQKETQKGFALFAPALLAALICINTLTNGQSLTVDARLAGLAAAVITLLLRAPILVVVFIATATTATVRAVT